jgi:hypothetical protein
VLVAAAAVIVLRRSPFLALAGAAVAGLVAALTGAPLPAR